MVHNRAAIALATIGGLMFAATYERRRSTLLVSIEHGLYGDFIFTVGLGGLFYDVHRALAAVGHCVHAPMCTESLDSRWPVANLAASV